jgi:hypothetical protein
VPTLPQDRNEPPGAAPKENSGKDEKNPATPNKTNPEKEKIPLY